MRLLLASASPRRAQLLRQVGYDFEVEPASIDESVRSGEAAPEYVRRMALGKAQRAVDKLSPEDDPNDDTVVVAADTVVVRDGEILGKPSSREDGVRMLLSLSDRAHEVLTGLCVARGSERRVVCCETRVWFRAIDASEAQRYWETGEPSDKAGGYGIQGIGGIFAQRIDGSYSSVVGLPLAELEQLLTDVGLNCWLQRMR